MADGISLTATKPTRTSRTSSIEAAAAKIQHTSSIVPKLKMVVYGRNKVGKTTFAASSDKRTLLIDCNERGYTSIRKRTNVDIYELGKWEDLDPIYWYLKSSSHPYEVVVIDTITMLATVCMKWVLKDDVDRDFTRDPLMADKRSWGKMGEAIKNAIIDFRNLPLHVIFAAQEKTTTTEDEDGGVLLETHPELSPSPRSTLLSSVDIIGRLYTREVEVNEKKKMERRMLLGAHPRYVSGNRFDELKYVERNPTLQAFLDRIGGTNADAE